MNDMITALLDQLCAAQITIDGCFLPEVRDHWKEERERVAIELADAWAEETKAFSTGGIGSHVKR